MSAVTAGQSGLQKLQDIEPSNTAQSWKFRGLAVQEVHSAFRRSLTKRLNFLLRRKSSDKFDLVHFHGRLSQN